MSSRSSGLARSAAESRYSDLLNPCRDLDKNWNINIAEALKDYLDKIIAANVGLENGEFSLNFSQAALLIQGSAFCFGKKVEYLYNLACQLLQQMSNEKHSSSPQNAVETTGKKKDTNVAGRTLEFVALDNIQKCNNINLIEKQNVYEKRVGRIPTVPLALIPLDSKEKGETKICCTNGEVLGKKKDFQMNICIMHSTGHLLLPTIEFENEMYDDRCDDDEDDDVDMEPATDGEDLPIEGDACSLPGVTTPCPQTVNGHSLANGDGNAPESASSFENPNGTVIENGNETIKATSRETDNEVVANNVTETVNGTLMNGDIAPNPRRRSVRQALKAQKLEEERLKREEEERQRQAEEEKGRNAWSVAPENIAEAKKQIQKRNVRRLPRKLKKRSINQVSEKESKSAMEFCCKNLIHVESKFSKKLNCGINNLSINAAFEHIIYDRLKKNEELLKKCCKKLKLADDLEVKEEPKEEERDSENEDDLGADVLPNGGGDDDDDDACNISPPSIENAGGDLPLNSSTGSSVDGMLNDSYEDLVRKHVENYMQDVAQFYKTTDLYQKVNKWEQRIKPVLEKENGREIFNIYTYGTRIIDKFEDNNRKQTLSFVDVCKGKKKWEVCRYFLASLQLANNSNLKITTNRQPSGTHEMFLTLLSRKRHQEKLDEFGHNIGEH